MPLLKGRKIQWENGMNTSRTVFPLTQDSHVSPVFPKQKNLKLIKLQHAKILKRKGWRDKKRNKNQIVGKMLKCNICKILLTTFHTQKEFWEKKSFLKCYFLRQSRMTSLWSEGFSLLCSAEVLFSPPGGLQELMGLIRKSGISSVLLWARWADTGELVCWHLQRDTQTWQECSLQAVA